jgi:hypothetical protein
MKTKSDVSQALKDVWEWKEKVYLKLRNQKDRDRQYKKDTDELIRLLGLKTLSR